MWKVNVLFGKLSSLRSTTGMFSSFGQDVFGLKGPELGSLDLSLCFPLNVSPV